MLNLMLSALLLGAPTLQTAEQALAVQDYAQAIAAYQDYLANVDPEAHAARLGLARALALSGQYPEAVQAYTELLASHPDDVDALLGRGQVYAWQQQFTLAEADLKRLLELAPSYADAWQVLANVYSWSYQLAPARAHLLAWQAQFPSQPEPWLAQAQFETELRFFPAAREALQQAQARGADPEQLARLLTRLNRLPGALPWEAQVGYEFQGFVSEQLPWHTLNTGLQFHFDQGAVALQSLTTQRFGQWDQAFAADAWLDLWSGGYGNFRLQVAPVASVLPAWDALAELYQTVFDNWELSGSYRLMHFPTTQVHFFSGGVGTYLGNWYLRAQPMLFLSADGPGGNVTLWARYFYRSVDDYIELRTGLGRRIAVVGSGPEIQGQTNAFGLLSAQYFITPHIGLIGSLNYNYDDQFADRFGASLGSRLRW